MDSIGFASSEAPLALFSGITLVTLLFQSISKQSRRKRAELEQELTWYTGSCHCFAVNFKLRAPKHLVAWDCNCSVCHMKKNWHFIIPQKDFLLHPDSESALTEYTFNTKAAKHKFCKHCGVQSFYIPRSNPDGVAVTLACVPSDQIISHEIREYDGQNWELFHGKSGISKFSKV